MLWPTYDRATARRPLPFGLREMARRLTGDPVRRLPSDQPAYKPGSVWRKASTSRVTAIHLGRRSPDASCNLPERLVRTDLRCPRGHPAPLLFGLAPGGVCRAAAVAGSAVRSYRTVSPLPSASAPTSGASGRRFVFCGTFPGVAPAGRYPAPFRPWSPDFPPRRPFGPRRSGRPAD